MSAGLLLLLHVQVSMNGMMETIMSFDGKGLPIRHIPGPEGVRGRNSDNALILEKLGWEPTIKLADGLKVTYEWIKGQLKEARTRLTLPHAGPGCFLHACPPYRERGTLVVGPCISKRCCRYLHLRC